MGRLEKINTNTEALVTFKNVSKSFGATKALIDCNIEFKKGEIHSLVGENGAGKSTLGKIILGAYRLDSGQTNIDGEDIIINSPGQAVKIGLVGISQELSLLPSRTVVDNIAMGRESTFGIFVSAKNTKEKVLEVIRENSFDLEVIGVGGVESFQDLLRFWKAGGKCMQIYTSLIYQGPQVLFDILEGIDAELEKENLLDVEALITKIHSDIK